MWQRQVCFFIFFSICSKCHFFCSLEVGLQSFIAFEVMMLLELIVLWIQNKPMPRVPDLIGSVGAGMISRLPR